MLRRLKSAKAYSHFPDAEADTAFKGFLSGSRLLGDDGMRMRYDWRATGARLWVASP